MLSIVMLSKPQTAFVIPLLSTSMALERYLDSIIKKETDYSLVQLKIMACISMHAKLHKMHLTETSKHDGCSQITVADLWGMSEAAISRQIDALIKAKLIIKSVHPEEKRKVILDLTKKGKTFVKKTLKMVDKELIKMFKPISMTARKQMSRQLMAVQHLLLKI